MHGKVKANCSNAALLRAKKNMAQWLTDFIGKNSNY